MIPLDSGASCAAYRGGSFHSHSCCYVVAYVDRVNIGFAAAALQRDLGLSDTAYGIGAGLFFLGYCLFEIPSNLLLERVGARRGSRAS